MPWDLNNKLFQACDVKYTLPLTTQIILCKLICPFAMALYNVTEYSACLLENQEYLLIQENSESKLWTMNVHMVGVSSKRRWSKMVA